MSKNKIAGTERPYTTSDLGEIISGFIRDGDWENKACLDYCIADCYYKVTEILNSNIRVYSITEFGAEGIYTNFYVEDRKNRETYHIATAKTLLESNEALAKMYEMSAYACFRFYLFKEDHWDNFDWSGFDVYTASSSGKEYFNCECVSMEEVTNVVNKLREKYEHEIIFYVDKYTRKKHWCDFKQKAV